MLFKNILLLLWGCTSGTHNDWLDTLSEKERKDLSFNYAQRASQTQQGTLLEQSLLDSAILLDSANDRAWMEKASWAIKIGDYKKYTSLIDKAVTLNPVANLGYRARNKLYCLRDYKGALDDLDRLDSLTPGLIDYPWGENIFHLRGLAHMQLGDTLRAVNDFTKCIETTIKKNGEKWVDIYSFVWRGKLFLDRRKIRESIKDFNTALKYSQECPEAHYYKGIALLQLKGMKSQACREFEMSLETAERGYIATTSYRDIFNQLYISDIEEQLKMNCGYQNRSFRSSTPF